MRQVAECRWAAPTAPLGGPGSVRVGEVLAVVALVVHAVVAPEANLEGNVLRGHVVGTDAREDRRAGLILCTPGDGGVGGLGCVTTTPHVRDKPIDQVEYRKPVCSGCFESAVADNSWSADLANAPVSKAPVQPMPDPSSDQILRFGQVREQVGGIVFHRPGIAGDRQDSQGIRRRRRSKLQTDRGQRVGHDVSISIRHESDTPPGSHRATASTSTKDR